jgi:hypothetical protein
MPRTSRYGLTPAGELPGTLKRSSTEAQRFTKALAGTVQVYGPGDQALRAAYLEFKRTFEKRGDHWIPKQPSPLGGASARGELMVQPGDGDRTGV